MTTATYAFWSAVDSSGGPDACWPWLRSTRGAGYGQCSAGHHPSRIASIAAYVLTYGAPPLGKPCVLHSCDNVICCNPRHLFAGTKRDNTRDMLRKGRGKMHVGRAVAHRTQRGATHSQAKLTDRQVCLIRELNKCPRLRQKDIGALFGVSQTHVSAVVRRSKRP